MGSLCCLDMIDIHDIESLYGTPTYVFDEYELIGRVRAIKDILGDIPLCYSIKANPFLIPALIPEVDRFEVCSPGELEICKADNVPPEKIIYSGVHKDLWDIEEAIEYGVGIVTAESIRHYELILEAIKKFPGNKESSAEKPVEVLLRLTSGNQFGMSLEDIEEILRSNDTDKSGVIIKGIHYFAGTNRKSIKKHREELEMLAETVKSLRDKYNTELPMVEYGPGLPFLYFADDDHSDTLAPLKELTDDLERVSEEAELSIEMGRFIASSCGYYMTTICDIKRSADTNWCIVDGGINHVNYLGQMMGMKVPIIMHLRDGEKVDDSMGENYCICGSLCTTNDILVRSMPLKNPKIGDVLVFANIGAYSVTEAMGLFLSRTLPRIVMVRGGESKLVRDHIETWEINNGAARK